MRAKIHVMKQILFLLSIVATLMSCQGNSNQQGNDQNVSAAPPQAAVPDSATADYISRPNMGKEIQVDPKKAVQIRGMLIESFGKRGFLDYKKNTMYEITDATNKLDAAYEKAAAPCHYLSESVYAVLTGRFVREGVTGFKVFEVQHIDTVAAKTPEYMAATGVPYEFWCHGTEPNWTIEISNFEGGIFYENVADGSAWFCPWITPEIKGDTWTYKIPPAPGKNEAMTIVVKKEKASDGMSSKTYDYSVTVDVKGAKLKGVAQRGPGKVLGPNGEQ